MVIFLLISGYDYWLKIGALGDVPELNCSQRTRGDTCVSYHVLHNQLINKPLASPCHLFRVCDMTSLLAETVPLKSLIPLDTTVLCGPCWSEHLTLTVSILDESYKLFLQATPSIHSFIQLASVVSGLELRPQAIRHGDTAGQCLIGNWPKLKRGWTKVIE